MTRIEREYPLVTLRVRGGTYPAVMNAANEEAVLAFHEGRLRFTEIVDTVQRVLDDHDESAPLTRETLIAADAWARSQVRTYLGT